MDGDGTYPAKEMKRMYDQFLITNADMVIGNRISPNQGKSFPRFHFFGNRLFTNLISCLFGQMVPDVLSGGRILNKRFVDQLAIKYKGFEVEIEITIKAIITNMTIVSVPIVYNKRQQFSKSKLKTWDDGLKIFLAMVNLFKEYRPKAFFGFISLILGFFSIVLGSFPVFYYYRYKLITHLPVGYLAASLGVLSLLSLFVSTVFVNRFSLEMTEKKHEEN